MRHTLLASGSAVAVGCSWSAALELMAPAAANSMNSAMQRCPWLACIV
jgi:hypothetical protein